MKIKEIEKKHGESGLNLKSLREKETLNFDWRYIPEFKEEYIDESFIDQSFEVIQIPHSNVELPLNNFNEKDYQFHSCYRKSVNVRELKVNERVCIKFEAVMTYAEIFCNGLKAGEHKGGYTPFSIDLTDFVNTGDNQITVHVDSTEREDIPPFGFVVDYLTFGGIYREVSLEYVHAVHVETMNIKTRDVLTESPSIDVDLYIHNGLEISLPVTAYFDLRNNDGSVISFHKKLELKGDTKERITIDQEVPIPSLWDLDNPSLYSLSMTLLNGDNPIDTVEERFGFREIRFDKSGFYLNGQMIKLRGLNRHQSYPYVGYAMPKSAQYKDAEILKYELGVNTVRLSHYPQSDHFLNRCDELGLLVFDEIPGWQNIGDDEWKNAAINHTEEMIKKDFNHPSIFIWGVRINESQDDDEFYSATNKLARELDDTRPTGGVRCISKSNLLEDVYTYNDFVHRGDNRALEKKKKITSTDKGYLITEHNGHMYPTKKYDDESHRMEQALRHMRVIDRMEGDDSIAGAIGWCMFDYNTHKDFGSGDKICYHGVMDMFRIPKHAAAVYASQRSGEPYMHVANSMIMGDFASSVMGDVHVFTNCDYIKLYRNGNHIATHRPDKKDFPHVNHPPVKIDDFIGDLLEKNERYSLRDCRLVKKLLMKANKTGGKLNILENIRMGLLFLKYNMNMNEAEDLYGRYFGGWGSEALEFTFEGYIGDECVSRVKKKPITRPGLVMEADSADLLEDETYDVTRFTVRMVDDSGNDVIYSSDAFTLKPEGPIDIIGPKTLSLIGGSTGFWVKSTGSTGIGKITLTSERFGSISKNITVEKRRL